MRDYTMVVEYAYDPLSRLVKADYSSGVEFGYAYDEAGNRTTLTETTPLSGTIATTYTYDTANRLAARAVSDGRSYTYSWSQRGELLAETTQGVDVRTFEWDAAGRLAQATVFTLTTFFTYTGDGTRVALEVEGVGVTGFIPDYGGRILVERTATTSTRYLYGYECIGEVRDGALLYYLADGQGYVRQSTGADGTVVDAWLFTPDGKVMAGPAGPVSHLVCGGVYDWSTGLIHKGGRYFDPTLGIWLALGPLVLVQGWRKRKKRGQRKLRWYVLVTLLIVGVGIGGVLTGCDCPRPEFCVEEWAPLPEQVSSEPVAVFPVHEPHVSAQGYFHWPCLFSLECTPQEKGQFIQELEVEASDPLDPILVGGWRHFWESWPVEAGENSSWLRAQDQHNSFYYNDFFTAGNARAQSGFREVKGMVKFFYVAQWPLPGWVQANPGGTTRTDIRPIFWDSGGGIGPVRPGTSHSLYIKWDGTRVGGWTQYGDQIDWFGDQGFLFEQP